MIEEINYKRRNIYINEDIEEEISKKIIRQIIGGLIWILQEK